MKIYLRKKQNIDSIEIGDKSKNQLENLLSNIPIEKTNRDFSKSVLENLKKSSDKKNNFFEIIYISIILSLFFSIVCLYVNFEGPFQSKSKVFNELVFDNKIIAKILGIFTGISFLIFVCFYLKTKKRISKIKTL